MWVRIFEYFEYDYGEASLGDTYSILVQAFFMMHIHCC